jgi:hypothetical protein
MKDVVTKGLKVPEDRGSLLDQVDLVVCAFEEPVGGPLINQGEEVSRPWSLSLQILVGPCSCSSGPLHATCAGLRSLLCTSSRHYFFSSPHVAFGSCREQLSKRLACSLAAISSHESGPT